MRPNHESNGQVVWADTTMMGWDVEKKKLVFFTFGMDGSIGNGDWVDGKEKDTWLSEGKITGPNDKDSPFKHARSIIRKLTADSYSTTIETKKGDGWETFMTCTYKRKNPEPSKSKEK